MLTTEIAERTGKQHGHIMRDTRKMLVELHGEGGSPNLETPIATGKTANITPATASPSAS